MTNDLHVIIELGVHFKNEQIPPMHWASMPDPGETLDEVMEAMVDLAEEQLGSPTNPDQRFWRFFPKPDES